MTTKLTMNRAQLCVARSLKLRGCPSDLMHIYLTRCGATQAEFDEMLSASFVSEQDFRFSLTKQGEREYNKQKRGQYF